MLSSLEKVVKDKDLFLTINDFKIKASLNQENSILRVNLLTRCCGESVECKDARSIDNFVCIKCKRIVFTTQIFTGMQCQVSDLSLEDKLHAFIHSLTIVANPRYSDFETTIVVSEMASEVNNWVNKTILV